MAYGLSAGAHIENGPAERAAGASPPRSAGRAWRMLTEACRLAQIEQALRQADGRIDNFPPAL